MASQEYESRPDLSLLHRVQSAILAAPTQFHIAEWAIGDVWPGAQDKTSGSACIAGWAVVLGCRVRLSLLDGAEIERLAREALALDQNEANLLFLFSQWPWEFQEAYVFDPRTLADYDSNARLAAQRIEVFVATRR